MTSRIKDPQNTAPTRLGYSMPAEWEKHDAVWLSWPHNPMTFNKIPEVEETYAQIISAIHESENIRLLVRDGAMKLRVMQILESRKINMKRIRLIVFEYSDVWFRDYGPTFIVNRTNGHLAMVRWTYNAYGGKYDDLLIDTNVPGMMQQKMKLPCFEPGIIMEGGSIDVNGKGTLLTSEQCLLNENRNSHLKRKDIERLLMNYLGIRHIIWLKEGVAGDDTDGHVDDFARFVNPTTVLCVYEEDKSDENYAAMKKNYELLQKSKDQDGNKLTVIKLPTPGFVGEKNARLPASYANFYIGNKVVLVPIYGHKNDSKALDVVQKAFPGRKVVGINCTDLIYGFGAIHCITQQQPIAVCETPKSS